MNIIFYLICILNTSILGYPIKSKCTNTGKNRRHELICEKFENFAELNFVNNETKFNSIESITIKPKTKLVLDNSFKWSGFNFLPVYSEIKFTNLLGIQLNNSFKYIFKNLNQKVKAILFFRSNLDFYADNMKLANCDQYEDIEIDLFTNTLEYMFFYVHYSKETCTKFFNNVIAKAVSFNSLKNTLITRNLLNWVDSNKSNIITNILEVYFDSYQIDINHNILNNKLFKKIEQIKFSTHIKQIDTFAFLPFDKLKRITFNIENPREILYQNNLWLNYLNLRINQTQSIESLSLNEIKKLFKFKLEIIYSISLEFFDQDLCLFNGLLHSRLIFLYTNPKNCSSCTNLWLKMSSLLLYYLYQNRSTLLKVFKNDDKYYMSNCIKNENDFKLKVQFCDFDKKFKNCIQKDKSSYTQDFKKSLSYSSYLEDFKEASFIFLKICLIPITLLLAFFINLITLKILFYRIDNNLIFNGRVFFFLRINIVLHLVAIIRSFLSLMSYCIEFNSVYCSDIRSSIVVQYFYVYFVIYFGSVIQFISNFSLIAFCFASYYLNMVKKNCVLNLFEKIKIKLFLKLITFVSFLINLPKLFKYKIVDEEMLDNGYHDIYPEIKSVFQNEHGNWILFFDSVLEVLKDITIIFLNSFIVILLFRQRLIFKLLKLGYVISAMKKRRLFLMSITCSLCNMVLRIPVLIDSISYCLIVLTRHDSMNYIINLILKNIQIINILSELFQALSYFVNFMALYRFNSDFRRIFAQIFEKRKSKFFQLFK